jgi:hypothetical protein
MHPRRSSSLSLSLRSQTEGDHEERYRRELQQQEATTPATTDTERAEDGQADDQTNGVPGDLGYFLHSWKLVFSAPPAAVAAAQSAGASAGSDIERIRIVCPPPAAFQAALGLEPFPSLALRSRSS